MQSQAFLKNGRKSEAYAFKNAIGHSIAGDPEDGGQTKRHFSKLQLLPELPAEEPDDEGPDEPGQDESPGRDAGLGGAVTQGTHHLAW